MNRLTKVGSTTWSKVFSDWRDREVDWGWKHVWQQRGFDSWEAWRETYFTELKFTEREWNLYRVDEPHIFVPDTRVTAFSGWKRYYPKGISKAKFSDIAKHPSLSENPKVVGLLEKFPDPTTIIGVRFKDELVIFEGLHRCATIALAAAKGKKVAGELIIAITDFNKDELEIFKKLITQKD